MSTHRSKSAATHRVVCLSTVVAQGHLDAEMAHADRMAEIDQLRAGNNFLDAAAVRSAAGGQT